MRDIHCHILPGVDDGAADLDESIAMLRAAAKAGVTHLVCTPHVRDPYFITSRYDETWEAYDLLVPYAREQGIELQMGWEVAHDKLVALGMEWVEYLHFDRSDEFLLELPPYAHRFDFQEFERTIFNLQGMGKQVIIAHPERCVAIQQDIEIARGLVSKGCLLQASADFISGGRLGDGAEHAKRLLKEGLYTYIASDAHSVKDYRAYEKAVRKYRL